MKQGHERRFVLSIIVAAGPLGFGLFGAFLLEQNVLPNLLIRGNYLFDFAGLTFRLGVLLTLLAETGIAVWWGMHQRLQEVRADEQSVQMRHRRRFLQRLDHELKNPLTIIRLGLANLRHNLNLDAEQVNSLKRVMQQTQRLQRLVTDLRWLAELEEGRIEHVVVDVKSLLEEVILLVSESSALNQPAITLNIQQTPWPITAVFGDLDLLVWVFRNLLDNALKFTDADGQVEVRAMEDGRMVLIEVADTGLGIPDKDIPHIFEELYRGQNVRSFSGSGLGLALVYRIVLLHNGHIRVRSREGQGTVFTVFLPLALPEN